jgi:hypothetical protein
MGPIVINSFLHAATILADACTKLKSLDDRAQGQ